MSDFTAIAGVSRSLRTLLRDRMDTPATISIGPPDVLIAGVTDPRVNLYLYHVQENGSLKNQEIPGHGHPSEYGLPPLSLNLHYLLTILNANETGTDTDLQAQQLLGDAMGVLHDFSGLNESVLVTNPAATGRPLNDPILDLSMRGQFEKIKICLSAASIEEFSKIWTALPKGNFRRSVVYEVSVVQIESRRMRHVAPPVRTRAIQVAPLRRPEISAIFRQPAPAGDVVRDPMLFIGQTLVLEGINFAAPKTWVRIGGLEPIGVTPLSDTRIEIPLPDANYPPDFDHPAIRPIPAADWLQPGPLVVEVLTERPTDSVEGGLDAGVAVRGRSLFPSNQMVFMLVPQLVNVTPASGAASATTLVLTGTRLMQSQKPCVVLIGDTPIPVPASATSTNISLPPAALTPLVTGAIPLLTIGTTYPVRVQVNGTQSREIFSFRITGL